MMKATDLGNADDSRLRQRPALNGPAIGRISKLRMDSVGVVVVDVLLEEASKVVLVQNDQVIEQLSPGAPNPSLSDPVLPRAPECSSPRLDPELSDCLIDAI